MLKYKGRRACAVSHNSTYLNTNYNLEPSLGFFFLHRRFSFPKSRKEQSLEIKVTNVVPQNYSEKGKKRFTGVRDHSYFYISSDKHNINSYILAVYKV